MAQPSTSAQVRAVALREAVAATNVTFSSSANLTRAERATIDFEIIDRAELFANYIENGVQQDA